MKKPKGALWKCRAVETEENQTTVSLGFPSPWKSLPRFPHSHSADECGSLSRTKTRKEPSPIHLHLAPPGSFFDEKMLRNRLS